MITRIFLLAALSIVALVPAAHGQPQTTIPDVFVTVHVTITDSRIALDRHSARRGDEVRFVMHNAGTKVHSFTLGTTKRGGGTQTGFSTMIKPKEQKLNLLFLDYRGLLPYRSIVKIDLSKPRMKGVFKVL
jgi:hypothetical protein